MFRANYSETNTMLKRIIFELAMRPETSKKRLIYTLNEYCTICTGNFPEELQAKWNNIYKLITRVNKDEYRSTFYNSLITRRDKTCSKIIGKIINISIELEEYIKRHS